MRRFLLICTILIPPLAAAWAENAVNEKATDFTLQDQHEKTVSLRHYAGRAVALIASDKEGSSQNAAWIQAVRDNYADRVVIQGIADVSGVPFFLKATVRNDFKKDKESILLDWKGDVFKAYGLQPGASNVILIDRNGMIRHRSRGQASPGSVQELFKQIDALH